MRRIGAGEKVVAGFAGATADAFTLFERLDRDKASLGIVSYGLQQPTLQEVFLQLAAEEQRAERDQAQAAQMQQASKTLVQRARRASLALRRKSLGGAKRGAKSVPSGKPAKGKKVGRRVRKNQVVPGPAGDDAADQGRRLRRGSLAASAENARRRRTSTGPRPCAGRSDSQRSRATCRVRSSSRCWR